MADKKKIQVRLVTPDRILLQAWADAVEVPSKAGYFEAIYGYAPVLAQLWPGEVRVHGVEAEGEHKAMRRFTVVRGFAEVLPDRVTILAETAFDRDQPDDRKATNASLREAMRARLKEGESLWAKAGESADLYDEALETIAEGNLFLDSGTHSA